jgi:catechol 2,3-dioxygenase-like lactoylglutathione lyase family enzyme
LPVTDDGVTVSRERREAPVGSVQLVSAAILTRLWVKTPCPHGPGLDVATLVACPPVAPGGSDLCFVWPGTAEEMLAHLRRHQVKLEEGPVARSGGRGRGVSVYFRDPDGSLLELITYQ